MDPTASNLPATSYDPAWDSIYEQGYYMRYPNESIVRFMFKNYGDRPNKNDIAVLDIGCGSGSNTWMLVQEGFNTHAVDGSRRALDLNRQRLKRLNLMANLAQADFMSLPYAERSFDAVIDDAAIQANKINNVERIFGEVSRVLKKGGKYFGRLISSETTGATTPNDQMEENTYSRTQGDLLGRERTIHFFLADELGCLLRNVGFQIIELNAETTSFRNGSQNVKYWIVEATK